MANRVAAAFKATDPRAAMIIDRCEQMSQGELQRLHGVMRDPHSDGASLTGDDWWAAEAAAPVSPETDAVLVGGVRVARGSRVRLVPSRRLVDCIRVVTKVLCSLRSDEGGLVPGGPGGA